MATVRPRAFTSRTFSTQVVCDTASRHEEREVPVTPYLLDSKIQEKTMTKDPMPPSEAPPPGAKASAELQPLFGDPTNDRAALYEIADVIRKALRDPEFIRLANEPDTDKSSRVEGEDA
jgi:hypothetical protein